MTDDNSCTNKITPIYQPTPPSPFKFDEPPFEIIEILAKLQTLQAQIIKK